MADAPDDKVVKRVRRAAVLAGLGVLVQLLAALHWTPATFIVSATLGAPLVLAGAALFVRAVWKRMRDQGAV